MPWYDYSGRKVEIRVLGPGNPSCFELDFIEDGDGAFTHEVLLRSDKAPGVQAGALPIPRPSRAA